MTKEKTDIGGGGGTAVPVAWNGALDTPKLSRRATCSLGVGLSASALLGFGGSPGLAAELRGIRYVLTDRRHPQSLEFGAILARRGAQRLEVTDGLTRLWRDALLPLWREKGGAVAGITQRGTWACIAEQARSWGRRSVLVGHHTLAEDGTAAAHFVSAPRAVLHGAPALQRCGGAWPQVMAGLAARCPAADARRPAVEPYRSPAAAGSVSANWLVSWIIA